MENSPIDVDMDGASEAVEQNKMSVVGGQNDIKCLKQLQGC